MPTRKNPPSFTQWLKWEHARTAADDLDVPLTEVLGLSDHPDWPRRAKNRETYEIFLRAQGKADPYPLWLTTCWYRYRAFLASGAEMRVLARDSAAEMVRLTSVAKKALKTLRAATGRKTPEKLVELALVAAAREAP